MIAEFIDAKYPAWTRCLKMMRHDFYHLPDYLELCAKYEGATTMAFYAEDGGNVPRIAFGLHMQDETNRYRVHLNNKGVPWHIFNDDLAENGTPDYTDPNVFPVLWTNHAPS